MFLRPPDHNELAYLKPELHRAPFGAFACLQAPEVGGATLLADCRRVLDTLHASLSLRAVSEHNSNIALNILRLAQRLTPDRIDETVCTAQHTHYRRRYARTYAARQRRSDGFSLRHRTQAS